MEEILTFYNKLHFGYCETIDDFLGHNPEIIDIDIDIVGFRLISKFPNRYLIKFLYKDINVGAYNRGVYGSVYVCGMEFNFDKKNTPLFFESIVSDWLTEHNKTSKELTIEDLKILQFYLEVTK